MEILRSTFGKAFIISLSYGMFFMTVQEAYGLAEIPIWKINQSIGKTGTVAVKAYFPTVCVLESGKIIVTYKAGAGHSGKSGRAELITSSDNGVSWESPEVVIDFDDYDDCILANGVLSSGEIVLSGVSYSWPGSEFSYKGFIANTYIVRSEDGGETWTNPEKVDISPFAWAYPFGKIIEAPESGKLYMTLYGRYADGSKEPILENSGVQVDDHVFIMTSKDKGKTWGNVSVVAKGYNEACAIFVGEGNILIVMRKQDVGSMASVVSNDYGKSWSRPRKITDKMEHPPSLLRISEKEILLTYGHRKKPFGVEAVLSTDNGCSWDFDNRYILTWDGDHLDFGYPDTAILEDGNLFTVYYIVYGDKNREVIGSSPADVSVKTIIWKLY